MQEQSTIDVAEFDIDKFVEKHLSGSIHYEEGEKLIRVKYGPPCWENKTGSLLFEDGNMVMVKLFGKDDGGEGYFHVRMPKDCITTELVIKA